LYCDLLSAGSDEENNVQEAIQQSLKYHHEETQRRFLSMFNFRDMPIVIGDGQS
jgi:hypothetical protein